MYETQRSGGRRTSRRTFLKAAAGTIGTMAMLASTRPRLALASADNKRRFAKPRPDLLGANCPKGLEIIQLTGEPGVPGSHIYMEAQIFTPDSKRFVLQRSGHAHGSDRKDPRHQFMLCDIEDRFALHPLTEEIGTTGPSVSPDGRRLYYFVDETKLGGGRLILKRVNLDGTDRQTLLVLDTPLPGTSFRPSHVYPLSTISSDGKRLAISACLGDGKTAMPPFGLMLFDLERPGVRVLIHGPTWCNMHPQFCRSKDPSPKRDILIQENHGGETDAAGKRIRLTGGAGADIHVIRDDGTDLRDMPWGRDGNEFCQGHQCWRGRTGWAITSTQMTRPPEARLIESIPVPHVGDIGLKSPGGVRNELSRGFPHPGFYHFATDIAGKKLVSDADPFGASARIYVAALGIPGEAPLTDFKCIARPKPSGQKTAHMHPFLSPDGRMAFFNSDESGLVQAFAVRGFAD
jgi:hypothetical protein